MSRFSHAPFSAFIGLGRQFSAILGVLTLTWCILVGIGAIEALFRSVIVYLVISVISVGIHSLLVKSYQPEKIVRTRREPSLPDDDFDLVDSTPQIFEEQTFRGGK